MAGSDDVVLLNFWASPFGERVKIVQYIDDARKNEYPPLLPSDPYLKAQARFWADFVDNKIRFSGIWSTKGEEQESAKKEFIDLLKVLEEQLGDKLYLVGESFGYADIALIPFSCWFYALETVGKMNIEKECPKLIEWVKRCMERERVSKSLNDPNKIYEYVLEKMKNLG